MGTRRPGKIALHAFGIGEKNIIKAHAELGKNSSLAPPLTRSVRPILRST